MYLTEAEDTDYRRACNDQFMADSLTNIRLYGSIPLAAVMAATEPNWKTTSIDALLWATDSADGFFGRRAKKR